MEIVKENFYTYYIGDVTKLSKCQIFVFGSNESGIHGKGAAKLAKDKYGAKWGVGEGPTGRCYAIPTKNRWIKTLELNEIHPYILDFQEHARNNGEFKFMVTQIGCGLAGYTPADIAPMFRGSPSNCVFDLQWKDYLE